MRGNTFGKVFQITTFGESHGKAVGLILDGCPAGLEITAGDIQVELTRRRPGQNRLTTPRDEKDKIQILSGIFEGKTTGTPIAMMVMNENQKSKDYSNIKDLYRPGHADFTYEAKYGIRDYRGGGRSSARETLARVAGGAIAKKILAQKGIEILAYVKRIENVEAHIDQAAQDALKLDPKTLTCPQIEDNILRCPDSSVHQAMTEAIQKARSEGDSVGGLIEVIVRGVPAGLGEPVFNKLSADLAHAFMSLPAVKGFEIGDGFASSLKRGSENNDAWVNKNSADLNMASTDQSALTSSSPQIGTQTNNAGGIIGGISNGENIVIRFALKPPSSISKTQQTVNKKGEESEINVLGRHDPCVAPRAVPIAEAMMALVLLDHLMLNKLSKLEEL
jgi:chorismate synthase